MDYVILETEWSSRVDLADMNFLSFTFWPNHENDHKQPPNVSSHILHNCTYSSYVIKQIYLHSSNEENSQFNKSADFEGNFFGGSAVTI